ncbi:hypothetical protein SCHPADRAFT_56336 [Schizopora paradoxa]|uniref:Uncharacterized protein n=1 Tax=Schizopora paradoxa TaxID=27342 RepID=A0A0H2S658_9AGAM|nr:hypothetical protein SCHPADRAFT_56336 [Schizopora paradoxa]
MKKERKTSRIRRRPQEPEKSYAWKLEGPCDAFPGDSIHIVTFQSRRSKLRLSRKKLDGFQFSADTVIAFCRTQLDVSKQHDYEFTLHSDSGNSTLFLTVTLKGTSSVKVPDSFSFDDIDKLGKELDQLSSSSVSKDSMSAITRVFSSVADCIDFQILDAIINTLKAFAAAHPLVHVVVSALLVPYELLKVQHEYIENIKTLAGDMCISLKAMSNAFPKIELEYAKEVVIDLLKVVVQASVYVHDFFNKGAAQRLTAAQFQHDLDDYKKKLETRRLDFREAALVQVLVDSGTISGTEGTTLRFSETNWVR